MKNLMITLGLLMLMTMGMFYDADCMELVQTQRQLKWICAEMAEAAAAVWEEQRSWAAAEEAAAEILRRNCGKEAVWKLEKQGNLIVVNVDLGMADMQLDFLDNTVNVSYEGNFDL